MGLQFAWTAILIWIQNSSCMRGTTSERPNHVSCACASQSIAYRNESTQETPRSVSPSLASQSARFQPALSILYPAWKVE